MEQVTRRTVLKAAGVGAAVAGSTLVVPSVTGAVVAGSLESGGAASVEGSSSPPMRGSGSSEQAARAVRPSPRAVAARTVGPPQGTMFSVPFMRPATQVSTTGLMPSRR